MNIEVNLHVCPYLFRRLRLEKAGVESACVVDQYVDCAEALLAWRTVTERQASRMRLREP